ncbi:MAG: phosphoenolpyruvate--protein phosphotransferase [Pseudomonadota bacterium]
MFSLHATGVGDGIAIGKARLIRRQGAEIPEYVIEPGETLDEIERLRTAWMKAKLGLKRTLDGLPEDAPDDIGAFLGVQLMILDDPLLMEEPVELIRSQRVNAESALAAHAKKLESVFEQVDDPYLSAKSADINQVIERVLGELTDDHGDLRNQAPGKFDGEIIVAHDLTPSDAVELKNHQIGAFITNLGGPISHTAILARSMGIPAIVGLHGGARFLRTGDTLIIDGKRGVVLVNPDEPALEAYRRRRRKILRRSEALEFLRTADSITLDGEKVELFTNIEIPEELELSRTNYYAGVGLYRTEFLFMNRSDFPGEEEQFETYRQIVEDAALPVTIRTLDLGADKQVDGGRKHSALTTNPALGRRAIRLCLHDLSLFKPQLRAIYRASAYGNVRMMVPMFSSMEELNQLFSVLENTRNELQEQGVEFDADLPIGGMIEVPAAAVSADLFAQYLDFLSIGTNDLIQYTLAIDRVDDEVNYLYDPTHPSVLRLIKMTIDAGKSAGIPVSMCGEMAGDPAFTRVLLGIGLRQFSMDPTTLTRIKQQIRLTDIAKVKEKAESLLHVSDPQTNRKILSEINA